jgi:phosphoesterase RecJ-like protein
MLSQASLHDLQDVLSGIRRVLIVSHVDPDGDTIGSALGLAWALRSQGLAVRLACQDPLPDEVGFLPGVEAFQSDGLTDEQLVIAVDTSDRRRMGKRYVESDLGGRPLVVIDHHVTNPGFGDVNLIAGAPATALLMLEVVDHLGVPLDATIATCLLTGIITDTQGFRTSNTTPEALAAAQRLMQAGAPLAQINQWAFSRRAAATLPVWGAALANATLTDGVLWAELPYDLLRQNGIGGEASSGLVNFFNTVREAQIAVVLTEQPDGIIDVSLRSKPGVDVSAVALALGGGGHAQAAGCQIAGELAEVRARVVAAAQAAVARAG